MGQLVKETPHRAVAFGGTVATGFTCTLLPSRTDPNPGSKLGSGGNAAAFGPISAMAVRKSIPNPGNSASRTIRYHSGRLSASACGKIAAGPLAPAHSKATSVARFLPLRSLTRFSDLVLATHGIWQARETWAVPPAK